MQNRIKERIKDLGILQKDLAEKMGITSVGLNQIVNTPMPKFETFEKVANALEFPLWKLILSDSEIEDIRNAYSAQKPLNQVRCPVCGATLKVTQADDK